MGSFLRDILRAVRVWRGVVGFVFGIIFGLVVSEQMHTFVQVHVVTSSDKLLKGPMPSQIIIIRIVRRRKV